MESLHPWVTPALVVFGYIGTWIFGAFKLGRAVEQMRAGIREEIDEEREKIIDKLNHMETKFDDEQKHQDHSFGEVGAAMRQYIANVEKEMHEIEIWGRDNFVLKDDFAKATDRLEDAIKGVAADIKIDFRERLEEMSKRINGKH